MFYRTCCCQICAVWILTQQWAVLQSCVWIKCLPWISEYFHIYNSAIPSSFLVVTEMSHAKSLDWDDSHLQCKYGCSPFITTDSQWWACKKVGVSLINNACQSSLSSLYQFVYTTEWWHLIYMLVSKTGGDIFTKEPLEGHCNSDHAFSSGIWYWTWVHVFIQLNFCLSVINSLIK